MLYITLNHNVEKTQLLRHITSTFTYTHLHTHANVYVTCERFVIEFNYQEKLLLNTVKLFLKLII